MPVEEKNTIKNTFRTPAPPPPQEIFVEEKVEDKGSSAQPKAKEKEKPSAKSTPKAKPSAEPDLSKSSFKESIVQFITDRRTRSISGLFLVFFSVYLLLAFVSWYFNWIFDADKLSSDLQILVGNPEVQVDNWMGKFGAILSNFFLKQSFGIGSFCWLVPLFVLGFKWMFGVNLIYPAKAFWHSFFLSIWLSVTVSFAIGSWVQLGGAFGYQGNIWLSSLWGATGTGMLTGFLGISYIIFVLNPSFENAANWFQKTAIETTEKMHSANTSEPDLEAELMAELRKEQEVVEQVDSSEEETEPVFNTVREEKEGVIFEVPEIDPADLEPRLVVREEVVVPVFETPIQDIKDLEDDGLILTILPTAEERIVEKVEQEAVPFVVNGLSETTNKESEEFKVEPKGEAANVAVGLENPEDLAAAMVARYGEFDPTLELPDYKYPVADLLVNYPSNAGNVTKEELDGNKKQIVQTLNNYNIEIQKIQATIGPTVTLYEIVPAPGVRISKIKNLEDDIALSLAALGIRIIAPMPGKGTIGIEVPNQNPDIVPMRALISSEKFLTTKMDLPVALGKTINNETFIADLAKMPHLLMAGATGQGKSVGLNAILVSLLYKKHPSQLKFVLVDPKKVELTLFNKIERHFLAKLPDAEEAIITDTKKVIHTIQSLCIEMDNRYNLLKDAQVRTIKEYNAKFCGRRLNPNEGHQYLPYIVLVVDEFADLIMTAGKEVEMPIARLAQLARAVGIHLIIATQRPSVNIITGTIKANFPARIAFRVTSKVDSRTILDAGGAEQLIGRGDMLLSTGSDLIRLQCAFVDTPEAEKITDFIGSQRGYSTAFSLPEYVGEGGSDEVEFEAGEVDSLFEDAARIVVATQQGSASLLQRKLKLGYNRAGRLVDQLEQAGIIGPYEGSKARQVLIKDEMSLDAILQKVRG